MAPADRKAAAFAAVTVLDDQVRAARLTDDARAVRAAVGQPPEGAEVWADFEARSAEYYGLLSQVVDLGDDHEAAEGGLPADVVRRVEAQPLDRTLLRANLRGYQPFGAKFALVQRRTILGDEMGLGKTMQAIAVVAHLVATGGHARAGGVPGQRGHQLEARGRAALDLTAVVMHGHDREQAAAGWLEHGGVAITHVRGAPAARPAGRPEPGDPGRRRGALREEPRRPRPRGAALADRSDRVLFLSGTPMENKVDEFRNLVGYLQPEVAGQLSPDDDLAGARAFRRIVAPAYLRRNQDDVLTELPEMVQVEEWERVRPGRRRRLPRRRARAATSWRCGEPRSRCPTPRSPRSSSACASSSPRRSTAAAASSSSRTSCPSCSRCMDLLGDIAVGPLTGVGARPGTADHGRRAHPNPAAPSVLVSQITAGGVGLNVQAASVVIFCEPQVKPTIEAQAVARAHRMGQTRTVQVHRLLVEQSVDQRMMEILGSKSALFEEFARQSEITDASPSAVDVAAPTETSLSRTILAEEKERLSRTP